MFVLFLDMVQLCVALKTGVVILAVKYHRYNIVYMLNKRYVITCLPLAQTDMVNETSVSLYQSLHALYSE